MKRACPVVLVSLLACSTATALPDSDAPNATSDAALDARVSPEVPRDAAFDSADGSVPIDATHSVDASDAEPLQPMNFCASDAIEYPTIGTKERFFTDTMGMFTQTVVVPIRISAETTTVGIPTPRFSIVERPGGFKLAIREVTISRSKCNFDKSPEFQIAVASNPDTDPSWNVAINDTTRPANVPRLTTGLWYVNIRNFNPPGPGPSEIRFTYSGLQ
jgi:hypothetical protein